MRQPTQGKVIKQRVWRFIEALLTHAEDSPDFEVHWEDEDTHRPKMVVKTKRRFLEEIAELKQNQVYEVINSLKNLELLEDRRFKQKRGSDQSCFALKLWSRDTQRNHQQFERVWKDKQPEKSKALEANYQKSEKFDWQNICKTALEEQKRMTTNRLLDSEMVFDLNQIHVPLALVERKKQDKRQGDDLPEKSHSYKPEYEETQKFEYEEFLAVLKIATNKKIAIIGEPGAGKTTLLQRIAFWVLENTDDLAIWIPLGNLPTTGIDFKDYLLNNWLQNTCLSVTSEIKADFEKQLTAGKVWLLLDGVDEMATSGNTLSFINNWLPAWSQNLHFVLTCRLNVWEANPNYLSGFQTYRTLEFNQEQVKQFINNCFQNRGNHGGIAPTIPALGEQLQQALNQPGKERIKDLVRNPLRLMLLCSSWHSLEGKLPDTKAELYQHFVDEVYRWKKDELRITPPQRKELNAKLKNLALKAIDEEENRFSLRHKFVESVLGEWDDELFQFALKVGWLNRVGVDARNKPVYAFYHPTFQEYFAALAIKDWGYFLNHVPDNPAQGIYRIFEPQWKEVILLWLGREDVGKEEKEEFIKELVEFEDGCGDWSALPGINLGFYEFRAYFLAAVGIAEFWNCPLPLADEIVEQIVNWGFGYYIEKQQAWSFIDPIAEAARSALENTAHTKAITTLVELIHHQQKSIQSNAAASLSKIGTNDLSVINALVELVHNHPNKYTQSLVISLLGKIGKNHSSIASILVELIEKSHNELTKRLVASSLWEIDNSSVVAIKTLEDLCQKSKSELTKRLAAKSLGQINNRNIIAIQTLEELSKKYQDQENRFLAAINLIKIDPKNQIALQALEDLSRNANNELNRFIAAHKLIKSNKDNLIAIYSLKNLIQNSQDQEIRERAKWILEKIPKGELTTITALVERIHKCQDSSNCLQAADSLQAILTQTQMSGVIAALKVYLSDNTYKNDLLRFYGSYNLIWHCAQNMTYPNFHKAWHSPHLQLPATGA